MPKLIIERQSAFLAKLAKLQVLLDDKPISKIANGKTESFEVPEGNHTLKIYLNKYNMSNSLDISCKGDETYYFKMDYLNYSFWSANLNIFFILLIVISAGTLYTLKNLTIGQLIFTLALMLIGVVGIIWDTKKRTQNQKKNKAFNLLKSKKLKEYSC